VAKQAGFTLIEIVIVFVLMGALVLIGMPRMMNTVEHNDVRGARSKVVALFHRARSHAIERNRHVTFRVNPTLVMITASIPGGGVDTVMVEDFAPAGIGLTTTATSIQIDSRGIATSLASLAATIVMSKGSHADTVRISGFGRVLNQ
jgi:prepilin-type N-terminal cleavage/methylation domain-containing protein